MPTSKPRYTLTDTGEVEEALNVAQRLWPDVRSRKELLVRLMDLGRDAAARDVAAAEAGRRRERQAAALRRGRELVDVDALLGDAAWR